MCDIDKEYEKKFRLLNDEIRGAIFVNHIQEHLKEGEKVICKICGKDVDTIMTDKFAEAIKKAVEKND